jgi:hypothetical protein
MRPIIRCALLAAALLTTTALPVMAAAAPSPAAADTITFDQYRDWRMHFIEQRQTQIAAELAEKDLTPARRTSLERQKAYYDDFAAMSPAERDRRFHERFDRIDVNHDGIIDAAERTTWHEKQRAYYNRSNYRHDVASDDLTRR